MTPTYEELVKALIVARDAMKEVRADIKEAWPIGACYTTAASFILAGALSHIQPLLENVSEKE